jgi:hypothetical protein
MSMPAQQPSRQYSLLIVCIVTVCVVAAAVWASDPDTMRAWHVADAGRAEELKSTGARQALIERLDHTRWERGSHEAEIVHRQVVRLRQGSGLRFVDEEKLMANDWDFNCDRSKRTFSLFSRSVWFPLFSKGSIGRFAIKATGRFVFNDGRWRAVDLRWRLERVPGERGHTGILRSRFRLSHHVPM